MALHTEHQAFDFCDPRQNNRGIRPQSRTPSSGEEVPRVTFDIVDQIDLRIRNRQEGRLEVW